MDDIQASDKKHQGVSLKKIGNTWLLKYHGKLRRLNLLQGAVNVHIEDNVICADDVLYNIVVKSEEDIFLEEIKEINIQATATQTTEQTVDVEEDEPDDGESDRNGSTDVSEDDSDLEKGHEEYVKKKGKLKVFYDKMKKLAKRKPPPPPKMQATELLYDELPVHVLSDDECPYEDIDRLTLPLQVRSRAKHKAGKTDDDTHIYENVSTVRKFRQALTKVNNPIKKYWRGSKTSKSIANDTDSDPFESHEEAWVDNYTTDVEFSESPEADVVYAIYTFNAIADVELSFKKDDRLKLLEKSSTDWCFAKHIDTNDTGYIPQCYVTRNTMELNEWYFDVDRQAAEFLLLKHGTVGSFFVRYSKNNKAFILTVLRQGNADVNNVVRHYRITERNGQFYLISKAFSSIQDIIHFYHDKKLNLGKSVNKASPVIYPRTFVTEKRYFDIDTHVFDVGLGKMFRGKFADTFDVTIAVVRVIDQMPTDRIKQEANDLYNFRHTKGNVVRIVAAIMDPEPMVVIGEVIQETLQDYIKDRGRHSQVVLRAAEQVAAGMAFLERNCIVHKELRTANVYICYPCVAKVAHPRLTTLIVDSSTRNETETDAWKWTAPEAIKDDKMFSTKSDVWSFGVLLYELITFGEDPYKGFSKEGTLEQLERGFRLKKPDCWVVPWPTAFYMTLLKCWNQVPESRLTFDFLLDFFRHYDEYASETNLNDRSLQIFYKKGTLAQNIQKQSDERNDDSSPNAEAECVATTGVPGASQNVERGFSVTVIYDYEAEEDDEITILTDDTITDVDPIDEGWWIGTTKEGTRGLFPANYVLLSKNRANIMEAESVATTGVPGASENVQRGFSVTVKYDYVAKEDDEITILTNDTITDVDPLDKGWLIGTTSEGTRGLFPASYVERI